MNDGVGFYVPMVAESFFNTKTKEVDWEVIHYPPDYIDPSLSDSERYPEHYAQIFAEDHGSEAGTDKRLAKMFAVAPEALYMMDRIIDKVGPKGDGFEDLLSPDELAYWRDILKRSGFHSWCDKVTWPELAGLNNG